MANGFPLSAVVGRADVMDWFNQIFFSFTYGGETLSLAACLAVMTVMEREEVIGHYWRIGRRLKQETNRLAEQYGLTKSVQCVGFPSWTTIRFRDVQGEDSLPLRSLFQQEAIRRGILTHGNHMLSYLHTDAVIDETLNVYNEVFPALAEAIRDVHAVSRLAGPPIQPVMRAG
jgi:4-aminobutyrate aminotransferase-like enzyme